MLRWDCHGAIYLPDFRVDFEHGEFYQIIISDQDPIRFTVPTKKENGESMKIIGISSSPRINGNSEILLDAFLKEAQKAGADVDKFRLLKMNIHPCIGDESCFKNGQCRFDDDAAKLYEPMLKADLVVLASPVYFYSTSTFAKLLIDRCQALWARKHILGQKNYKSGGRGFLISTGASSGEKLFEGSRLSAKYFFEAMGKNIAGCLCIKGVDEKKAILKHPTALAKAMELGWRFVGDPSFTHLDGCENG